MKSRGFSARGWRSNQSERLERMSKLQTDSSRLDLVLTAYYEVLLEDSGFCDALRRLLTHLDGALKPILSKLVKLEYGLTRGQKRLVIYGRAEEDPSAYINRLGMKEDLSPEEVYCACSKAASLLNRFSMTWKLPESSKEDLLSFHYQARLKRDDKVIFQRKQPFAPFIYGDWIAIPDLYYDPSRSDRKWLEQQIKIISKDIRHRADKIEQELRDMGMKPMSAKWRAPLKPSKLLVETAHIFYLRAVCGDTWGKIAQKYKRKRQTVLERAQKFAKEIGVALPEQTLP
jgi:hypothetical protein